MCSIYMAYLKNFSTQSLKLHPWIVIIKLTLMLTLPLEISLVLIITENFFTLIRKK